MYQERNEKLKVVDFSELKGKTIKSITGLEQQSEQVKFECTDGSKYRMSYYQDCCASCSIEDVAGNVEDLIGTEILLSEEVSSNKPDDKLLEQRKADYEKAKSLHNGDPEDFYYYGAKPENDWQYESETWTFYKLATIKGYLTIRWYGSSNGYYSESATFEREL